MFSKAGAEAYFNAEKFESLLLIVIGIAAIITALVLYVVNKTAFYVGLAIPLVVVALLQLVVGYSVYVCSDAQRKDIVYKMDMDPASINEKEVPRMEKVMKNFVIYRYTEIFLLVAGLMLFLYVVIVSGRLFLKGLGAGLVIQAAIMLAADGFAERRGLQYLNMLTNNAPMNLR